MEYGSTLKKIRVNKGYSQSFIAKGILSQSSFSKFEKNQSDINFKSFFQILEKLDMSFKEFLYIHENYGYRVKQQLIYDFFSLPYNDVDQLDKLTLRAKKYLESQEDQLVIDILLVCEALIYLEETKDIPGTREKVSPIWERMDNLNNWYSMDLRLLNVILYFFPTDVAIEISQNILNKLDAYGNFEELKNVRTSLQINLSFMLINSQKYSAALKILNRTLEDHLPIMPYQTLAVCLVRKEICMQKLTPSTEQPYLQEALTLVKIYKDSTFSNNILQEFKNYVK